MIKLEPYQQKGRSGWYLNWRIDNKRVNRSLDTNERHEAYYITDCISSILNNNYKKDSPELIELIYNNSFSAKAYEIFFREPLLIPNKRAKNDDILFSLDELNLIDSLKSNSIRFKIQQLLIERSNIKKSYNDLIREQKNTLNKLSVAQSNYSKLSQSIEARILQSTESCPTLGESYELYEKFSKIKEKNKDLINDDQKKFRRYLKDLPQDKKMSDISHNEIIDQLLKITEIYFSDDNHKNRDPKSTPISLWNNCRRTIAKLFNWCAKEYEYFPQMKKVPKKKDEQKEIEFHGIFEVERIITDLEKKDDYYHAAVIAIASYAGLRREEICMLRKQDFFKEGEKHLLKVTPHNDGFENHTLKRGWTKRTISVNKKYLLPRIKNFLNSSQSGEYYLFPKAKHVRPRKGAHPEKIDGRNIYVRISLRTPDCMTFQSLRRTFGSIMIRRLKSYALVSKLMGNSAQVCEDHYACIITESIPVELGDIEVELNESA